MPIFLATLQPSPNSTETPSRQNTDNATSQGFRINGTAVMDMGHGVLRDVNCKILGPEAAARVLSRGSHAFVECYGERHLRCTWHAFDFGFAGGHSLLADRGMVLMSGEIEVDALGRVTRWLMSQCGLAMPPRWAVVRSGLPITSAWAFIAGPEVDALSSLPQPVYSKEAMIASGRLERLDETALTPNSSPRAGSSTLQIRTSGANRSPPGERIHPAPVEATSDKSDNLPAGVSRDANSLDSSPYNIEDNTRIGAATAGTGAASVVPSRTIPAEDTWVMKLGDDFDWEVSVSQSTYAAVREALASCNTYARGCKPQFLCCQRQRQVSPGVNDGHSQQQRWRVTRAERGPSSKSSGGSRRSWSEDLGPPFVLGQDDLKAGRVTVVDGTDKTTKYKNEDAIYTRADARRNFSISSPPRQVHLEMVLESRKGGSVIADKGHQVASPEEK
jgi:hypothetical protein